MGNDIVHVLGKLDNFASEFMHHLHLIRTAAKSALTCNETRLINLLRTIENMTKQANDSMCAYYEEYNLFSQIVKTNPGIASYQIAMDDSTTEYVR